MPTGELSTPDFHSSGEQQQLDATLHRTIVEALSRHCTIIQFVAS